MHRVRPLPGRVPGVRDGEDPLAEAPDHGHPRPGVRAERGADRRQRRARAVDLGLRHLRRVRRGVPGVDRAHRPHRRPAAEPRDGRLAFPAEAEPMLRDVERASNPWGKPQTERAAWAESLGVRVLEPGDPAPEYLYWVGCAASFDERAKKSRRVDGEAAAEGGRRLRDPRPARGVHGRSGAADGQRVRLPGVRGAERLDAERAGRAEDRRELPALLQHARERVRRLRRQLRGAAPHGAARRARRRRPAAAGGGLAVDHVPRQLLSRAPQRRADPAAQARRT